MNDRHMQEKIIRAAKFAMNDAALFLDTHPYDIKALEYFKKYQKITADATAEYTAKFGPITMDALPQSAKSWTWIDGPWPWEKEAN
ncbi:MAG: spore coat protein CotJB [Oscillospiraceae bacterium]|nr:spore coat protein CotJB [Oscillospiraceae bacterium]